MENVTLVHFNSNEQCVVRKVEFLRNSPKIEEPHTHMKLSQLTYYTNTEVVSVWRDDFSLPRTGLENARTTHMWYGKSVRCTLYGLFVRQKNLDTAT
jgi:hypothetical protein